MSEYLGGEPPDEAKNFVDPTKESVPESPQVPPEKNFGSSNEQASEETDPLARMGYKESEVSSEHVAKETIRDASKEISEKTEQIKQEYRSLAERCRVLIRRFEKLISSTSSEEDGKRYRDHVELERLILQNVESSSSHFDHIAENNTDLIDGYSGDLLGYIQALTAVDKIIKWNKEASETISIGEQTLNMIDEHLVSIKKTEDQIKKLSTSRNWAEPKVDKNSIRSTGEDDDIRERFSMGNFRQ